MYCVIIKKEVGLPSVVSKNNSHFPDYMMSGYEIIFEGSATDCNEVYEEMLLTAYQD